MERKAIAAGIMTKMTAAIREAGTHANTTTKTMTTSINHDTDTAGGEMMTSRAVVKKMGERKGKGKGKGSTCPYAMPG